MKKTKLHAVIKTFLSVAVLCAMFVSTMLFPGVYVHADTLEDLEAQYDAIEDKMKENEKKIKALEDDKENQSNAVDALEEEISGLNSQIGILDSKISMLNSDIGALDSSIAGLDGQIADIDDKIAEAKQKIVDTEKNIDDTCDKLLHRLAASYMMGDASTLDVILGAKSLAELLTWKQYMQNATDYDNQLINGLEDDLDDLEALNKALDANIKTLEEKKSEINKQKAEVQTKRADVQSSANELESKKGAVQMKHSEAIQMLKKLDSQSKEYARVQKQLADEQEKIDAEINAYLASNGSSADKQIDVTNDGTLIWPVPYSNCYISAYFPTYPSGGAHKGIDICVSGGTEGKNIVAAQSGKVIQMGYNHWSMGNYIILDHGNGLFTAYYHASKLLVGSVGQKVEQGQVIALIGQTGNATGPHLHFEVRVNKGGSVVQVNPLNYVSKP